MSSNMLATPLRENLKSGRVLFFFLCCIVLVASIPLLNTNLVSGGQDLNFHLARIDGIADGLAQGVFPVRIQTVQAWGYGFPIGLIYPDALLYIPAVFHLFGLSLAQSYLIFMIMVNAANTYISYWCFYKMFGSETCGIVASTLWTLFPYRLIDVYLRGAVGETLALLFYPIFALGIFCIFRRERDGSKNSHTFSWFESQGWVFASIGVAGIVYSHLVSTVFVLISLVPILVIGLIYNHDRSVLKSIIKSVTLCILLVLAFAVPFLDFYQHGEYGEAHLDGQLLRDSIKRHAIQPAQLLMIFSPLWGGSNGWNDTVAGQAPFEAGWTLLLGFLIWAYLWISGSDTYNNTTKMIVVSVFVGGGLCYWLTTRFFPWAVNLGPIINYLLGKLAKIEFSWRFLGPASFLAVILACLAFKQYSKISRPVTLAILLLTIGLTIIEAGFIESSFLYRHQIKADEFSGSQLLPGKGLQYQFLPVGTDVRISGNSLRIKPVARGGVTIEAWDRNRTTISLELESNDGGTIILPLYYYPNYRIDFEDGFTGSCELFKQDETSFVGINVAANTSGSIKVYFDVPVLWSISFAVSAISWVSLVVTSLILRKRIALKAHPPMLA